MQDNVCLQDILNGCIGLDEERHPNAGVILYGGKYYKNEGEFLVGTQRIRLRFYNIFHHIQQSV